MTSHFHRPATLDGAVRLLQERAPSLAIAGGQSVLPDLHRTGPAATHLIAIDQIGALHGIEADDTHLHLGGAETHHLIGHSDLVRATLPALAELALMIGDPQIRHRGTIAGALVAKPQDTDYVAALLALDGHIRTTRRSLNIADLTNVPAKACLLPDELIISISVRRPEAALYQKHAHPAAGYAALGLFCARSPDQTHCLALIAQGRSPCRVDLSAGQPLAEAGPDLVTHAGLTPFEAALLAHFIGHADTAL
jgi:carbon-monoxide dehydrogenase medium subunit